MQVHFGANLKASIFDQSLWGPDNFTRQLQLLRAQAILSLPLLPKQADAKLPVEQTDMLQNVFPIVLLDRQNIVKMHSWWCTGDMCYIPQNN